MANVFVHTVIGSQLSTKALRKTGVNLTADDLGRVADLGNLYLLCDPRDDGISYLCTFAKMMDKGNNDTPTVIYQSSNWNMYKVMTVLEPLGLWESERFGVWAIPVWKSGVLVETVKGEPEETRKTFPYNWDAMYQVITASSNRIVKKITGK